MSIKFNCQHCQKSLKVNAALAGKKARCPGCKQVITIPTLDVPPPEDVEALAAAALADQPAAEEEAPAENVKFACPMCDEQIEAPVDLAGKRMPCPECRNIIKVPEPQKKGKRDWRKAEPRGPAAGLRRDEQPAPEGAWGTNVSRGVVSRTSLEEADAIPVVRQRRTPGQWVALGVKAAAVAAVLVVAVLWWNHRRGVQTQTNAADKAAEFVSAKPPAKLSDLEEAAVRCGLGEYYLHTDVVENLDTARTHLHNARAKLSGARPSAERDALLIDVALTQVELGGTKEQVQVRARLDWNGTTNEIRQSLTAIGAPEARAEAVREVTRKLVQRGQAGLAQTVATLASSDKDRSEFLAVAAVELLLLDQQPPAEAIAGVAAKPYDDKPRKDDKAPTLLALLVALKQDARAAKGLMDKPAPGKPPLPFARLGYAPGWALRGEWEPARQLAELPGPPADRLEALVSLAEIGAVKNPDEARKAVTAALGVLQSELRGKGASPWLVLRLVRAGAKIGMTAEVQPAADAIEDPGMRGRAQVAVLQARLGERADPAELDKAAAAKPPVPVVLEFLARHNARYGSSAAVVKQVATWEPETLRALGYVGVALGEQDTGVK